jgi:short-subunit dehydrogenase
MNKLTGQSVLLTGAAGGVGQLLALALSQQGAELALVDRNTDRISTLCNQINQSGGVAYPIVTDFESTEVQTDPAQNVVDQAMRLMGKIDILIINAGILDFIQFSDQQPSRIKQMMHINATIPMLLTRAILPHFAQKNHGHLVNIGSVFGAIGFPHYAAYSASKFAMHGFSQAIRRELTDTNIKVTYIAPRAIKTPMNNDLAKQVMIATKTNMDEPEVVVAEIMKAIKAGKAEYVIGQPESFFTWLNGFLPSLVSAGLKKNTQIARQFLVNHN